MSDSRSLPLYVGLGVLVLAGLFLVGRNLLTDGQPSAPATSDANAVTEPTHPQRLAARDAIRGGKLQDAVTALRQVPQDDPAYIAAASDLAVVYERMGQTEDALQTADHILGLRSDVHDARFVRCRAFYKLGRLSEAEVECLRGLELIPDQTQTRYSLGLVRIAQGRLIEGINAYYRAVDGGEERHAMAALHDLTELEQQQPESADVQYALAFFARTLGSRGDEKMRLERYLELAPNGSAASQARAKLAELGLRGP